MKQRPPTAGGVVFLSLEDETGLINVVLMPDVFKRYRSLILSRSFFEVKGFLEKKYGVVNVIGKSVRSIEVPDFSYHFKKRYAGIG